jgi:hypothetical protein
MSDNENGFLLKRISELEKALVEANAEAKKRRLKHRDDSKELQDLRAEKETWTKERDALKSSPTEWQAKYEKIEQELRARDHRDVWQKAIGDQLNEKVTLEKVWAEIQYQVGEQLPSESEIKSQVKAAREAAPYLFRQPSEAGTPAPAGAQPQSKATSHVPFDASRGAPDTGSPRYKVLRSDMQNASFMMSHSKQIAEASRKGVLDIVPD